VRCSPFPIVDSFGASPGTIHARYRLPMRLTRNSNGADQMNSIIYLIGLIVVIMAVLSLIGLR
jgi:hypothetical protein